MPYRGRNFTTARVITVSWRHRQLGCGAACGLGVEQVAGGDDDTSLPQLCRLSLPGRSHQPRGVALSMDGPRVTRAFIGFRQSIGCSYLSGL